MRMSSRLVRAGIVVFTLASMTALGCSILVDFDETKIPTDDAGDSATAETSTETGTPTDSGVDSGSDTGTPTDSGDDATDGGDAADGGDAGDGGSDATDGGSDATDAADTTPADTTPADTASDTAEAATDSAADTAEAATDSASDTAEAATDSAADTAEAATDSASDAAGDSAGDASDGGTGTSFTANLDGGQVLPANTSTATGKISCTLNVAETALDCTITHTVSGATSIRIAEAFGGLASSTALFTFDAATSPQTKSFTVTSGQVTSLKAGKLYVDVPSSLTGGEIRGQLLKPGQKLFTAAPLSGANQVPAVTSTVTGGASCIVDGTAVTCNGAASGFAGDGSSSSPAAAHIHEGGPTTNGGVSVSLTLGTFASDAVSISGTATVGTELDATKLAASTSVAASQYYVNLHTSVFGGGAARAQLVLRMTAPSP